MRGADAWAGALKAGGRAKRAAKMVVLDVDHPDIEQFISVKVQEEEKAAVLASAGVDLSISAGGGSSVAHQNSNHAVRVTDEFMQRACGRALAAEKPGYR
jgi:ribonucleoside-diphosphate reductase alpha chain